MTARSANYPQRGEINMIDMTKFKIKNSPIGQLTDSGNNIQIINDAGNEAIARKKDEAGAPESDAVTKDRIFIVHGHDNTMKEAVASVVRILGLEPIILNEQPNEGNTIIEKFEKYANVGFAIVLLSPDDQGYAAASGPTTAKSRARQNVVFELGYFAGRHGRSRVFSLYREDANFETPSDISGVAYTPYDNHGAWKTSLIKELKAAGYRVDANKLI